MQQIRDALPKITRHYTDEEIADAKRKAMERNTICSVDCPVCHGIGYVTGASGKLDICPNVDPLRLYSGERYGVDGDELKYTWAQIKPFNNTMAAVKAVKIAMERGHGWVYLYGPPGLGKTLVLKIAVAQYLQARRGAAYCRMAEIIDDLRAAFDAKNPSEESQRKLDWWAGLPLLAIDEFDRVRATEYAEERRFLLMDRRYEMALREKNITLMASNNDPSTMDGYLWDRIRDGRFQIVYLTGHSVRPGTE